MDPNIQAKYATLLADRPKFHAQFGNGNEIIVQAANHALSRDVLDWIANNIAPGSKTIETGCGYSTVIFCLLGAEHIVVSPFKEEHDAIKRWCSEHGISTEATQFIAKPSQEVIPFLEHRKLDLVLIDGDHAFPAPFIDWYYTADQLKEGGHVIVDDIQISTGAILNEFLRSERGRWRLETELGQSAIFTKLVPTSVVQVEWFGLQPFCAYRRRGLGRRIRRKLAKTITHPEDALFWD